jgi:hypothetical protein
LKAATIAATTAATGPAGADFRGCQLTVRFRARGKDAVADFEILQRGGLTFLAESGFVIDHDDHLIAATVADLDGIPVDRSDFPERPGSTTPWSHSTAATLATAAAGTTGSALTARAAARSTHALGPLKLFRRHAIDKLRRDLFVTVRISAHCDVITNFEILKSKFLRLLLPRLPLAVMGLIRHHDGLGGTIRFLDLEPINPH